MPPAIPSSPFLKKLWIWTLGLALFFGLMGTTAYFSLGLVLGTSREIQVPDLQGRDIVDVLQQMDRENLGVRVAGFAYSETLAQNRVVRQDPPPGHVLKTGREVRIILSRGPQKILVPAMQGLRREEALPLLEARSLATGHVSMGFHDTIPEGQVIASDPAASQWLASGASVHLLISAGKRPVLLRMPDLRGMDADTMLALLEKIHLRVSSLQSASNPDFPANRVVDQKPLAGAPVPLHGDVLVVINQPENRKNRELHLVQGMRLVRYRLPHSLIRSHIRGTLTAWGTHLEFVNDVVAGNREILLLIPGASEAHVRMEENGFPVFEARLPPFTDSPEILYDAGRYGTPLISLAFPGIGEAQNPQDLPQKDTSP